MQKILLHYDRAQDRMLFSFLTNDSKEYQFWITRRMLKSLWDILCKLRETFSQTELQERTEDHQAAKQVQPEPSFSSANQYATPISQHPLGEEPLILVEIQTQRVDNRVRIRLVASNGKFIEFFGDPNLIPQLRQLIVKTLPIAEWDLELHG